MTNLPASFLTAHSLQLELTVSQLIATWLRQRADLMRAAGSKLEARTLDSAAELLEDGVSESREVIEKHGPAIAATVGDVSRLRKAVEKSEKRAASSKKGKAA